MSERLDSDVQLLIHELSSLDLPPLSPETPEEARAAFRTMVRTLSGTNGDGPEQGIGTVHDRTIDGRDGPIPVRVYEPTGDVSQQLPVVVLMHGGGWMVGDLDTHDEFARAIARTVEARVVSVHYRLAPEHPFPAAIQDCLDVTLAVSYEPTTLSTSVAGDSAGGNLAAAVAMSFRQSGAATPIAAQLLIYPALDPHRRGGSSERFADGYLLTTKDMAAYDEAYLPTYADRFLPLASPLRAPDLTGLPPAIVVTAGFDPLLDEGREYARRLIDADVQTTYLQFPTLTHGWLEMAGRVPAAAAARTVVLEAFAALLRIRAEVCSPDGQQTRHAAVS